MVTRAAASRQMVRAFSGPMAQLAALEASSRVAAVLGRSTTTMRKFNTNLVTHEIAFVVLRNALLRCLTSLKFHKAISDFQFNVHDASNFAEAAFKIFSSSMFRQAANVDLVRLDLLFAAVANVGF